MRTPLIPRRDFHVYAYFRPDGQPCYIGYGRNGRWFVHTPTQTHNAHLAAIIKKYGKICALIRDELTIHEARELEILLIEILGREDLGTGPLVNRTEGGEGCPGLSSESRQRISTALKGKPRSREAVEKSAAGIRGKNLSEEHRLSISTGNQGLKFWKRPDGSFYRAREARNLDDVNMTPPRKPHSEATKQLIALKHTGRKHSQEVRDRRSILMKGVTTGRVFWLTPDGKMYKAIEARAKDDVRGFRRKGKLMFRKDINDAGTPGHA
jgi:hypothetical protein